MKVKIPCPHCDKGFDLDVICFVHESLSNCTEDCDHDLVTTDQPCDICKGSGHLNLNLGIPEDRQLLLFVGDNDYAMPQHWKVDAS